MRRAFVVRHTYEAPKSRLSRTLTALAYTFYVHYDAPQQHSDTHVMCRSRNVKEQETPVVDNERERVRVAVNMLRDEFEELKKLAEAEGETVSGYLRKALATERYLKSRTDNGGKILIEQDGVQREIVFR